MATPQRRVPRRNAQRIINPESTADTVLAEAWDAFDTTEDRTGSNDGAEDCAARLYFRRKRTNGTWSYVEGATGRDHGHAEMDALHQLAEAIGDEWDRYDVQVQCEAKPCCKHCSAVLGLLNVEPFSTATQKSRYAMGSTEWGMSASVRSLVQEVAGVHPDVLAVFGARRSPL